MFDAIIRMFWAGLHKLEHMLPPDVVLPILLYAVALAAITCVIELVAVGWESSAVRKLVVKRSISSWTDIASFVLTNLSLSWYLGLVLTFGTMMMASQALVPHIALGLALGLPPVVNALVLLVAIDFLDYWLHRIHHESRALWELHRYHHSASEMTVLTVARNHPVEVVLKSAAIALVAAILGAAPVELFGVTAIRMVISGLKHSEAQWRWGWFGKYVLQSPHGHVIHHSTDPHHFNTNYATLFSIWDVLFGTYRDADHRIEQVGLDDPELNSRHFVHDMYVCYVGFLRELSAPVTRQISAWRARRSAD